MRFKICLLVCVALMFQVAGCSQQEGPLVPRDDATVIHNNKDGTEFLGEIAIADGSGIAQGGVGMAYTDSGELTVDVPAEASIVQVLLYWMGGTTSDTGDNEIEVDGNAVTGVQIGGATNFYNNYWFSAYRADVTSEGWVTDGANSFTITGMDFDWTGGNGDENSGVGMIVVYDDGSEAELQYFDGLDMAFYQFSPTLDGTEPVIFNFAAAAEDRMGKLVVQAGSVGEDRPNYILVSNSMGQEQFDDELASTDGNAFDSIELEVFIPAGDTQLVVQLFSTESETPLGASLGWMGGGLSVPVPELGCLGDYVWHDLDMDGIQDDGEEGIEDVRVYLFDCEGVQIASTTTDMFGAYMFCELPAGDYMIKFALPNDYVFSPQDQGADDAVDSDADPANGQTACITLGAGETDLTWDAGMYMPVVEEDGCRMTGGGNSMFDTGDGVNIYTFGGQAGAPLASQPQPWGNWTHHQKKGPAGSFVFHAGTPSAPEGTEIDWITCMDPGWCVQARKAPTKQLDFAGVGTFKNMRGAPDDIASNVEVGESLHWFEVNVDDLGEPGGHDQPEGCDPLGYGRNGGTELADCDCPDFYRIKIYAGMDDSSEVMYEVFGYIDNGNLQLHPPTGRDRKAAWY